MGCNKAPCGDPPETLYDDCTTKIKDEAVKKLPLYSEGACHVPCT